MPWDGAIQRMGRSFRQLVHSKHHSTTKKTDICWDLCDKASADFDRYLETHDLDALYKSIALLDQAKDMTDEQPSLLNSNRQNSATDFLHLVLRFKAQQLRLLFHETDEAAYLEQSIDILQTLYKHPKKPTSDKFAAAIALAQHLSDRYFLQLESNHVDLEAAVDASRFAISIPKPLQEPILEGSRENARYLEIAGLLTRELFDVVKGIYCYEWGQVLQDRSTKQQDVSILATALNFHTQATQLIPSSHPLHVANAVQLGSCEGDLLKLSSDTSRVDQTITLLSQLDWNRVSTDDRVRLKITMSELSRGKFKYLSKVEDLDLSIEAANEAVGLPTTDTTLHISALECLSTQLAKRGRMQHSQADISLAIDNARKVVTLVSKSDNVNLSRAYTELGGLLGVEFSIFRKVENLNTSIKYHRLALDILPQGHALRALTLHALCLGLRDQFQYTRDSHMFDEAIELERQALAAVQESHTDKAVISDQLSSMLQDRYQASGNSQDLQESIAYAEAALSTTLKSMCFSAIQVAVHMNNYLYGICHDSWLISDRQSAVPNLPQWPLYKIGLTISKIFS